MKTVIFDLDDTLLSGDSEFKWAEFTVEKGLIDKDFYHSLHDHNQQGGED